MDEREALHLCQAGDKNAFAVLVRQYQTQVLGLCLRMTGNREDAADVAQQTFVQAFRHLVQYDPDQPFRPWLFRIATNECVNFLRRHKRAPLPADSETLEAVSDPADGAPALVDLAEDRERVRTAVAQLPLQYRQVVVAYYFQELSYQEIARQTGLPIGTVGTLLHRAKQQLRKLLTEAEVNQGEAHRVRTDAAVPGR
ncbi:MAG TPA: sigma-70 family RNA polymerase sigma factor [Symbiobacteriaceae bacterium]|nr:sigma-70 family RNA polymerase sigma factor [Symbiobacteriaceae bacterium]